MPRDGGQAVSDDTRRLPYAIGDEDDTEVLTLIESWRYRGPVVDWDAIVGRERQIRRCQEIVEPVRRPEEELARRLSPHHDATERLAEAIQEVDDQTLSGEALHVASERAIEPDCRTPTG